MSIKKKVLIFIMFAVVSLSLNIIFAKGNQLCTYTNIFFDSHLKENKIPTFKEARDSAEKEININFSMLVYGRSSWIDLFETTHVKDRGIRLELSPDMKLTLMISDGSGKRSIPFTLIGKTKINKYYNVDIKINKEKRIQAFVDGKKCIDTVNNAISYYISYIAVGTGYGESRPFNGVIKNFSIKYGIYNFVRNKINNITLLMTIIFLLLAGIVFYSKVLVAVISRFTHIIFHVPLIKEDKIRWISAICVTGFIIAVLYHYWQGTYAGRVYPFNTFLFEPHARFSDFFDPLRYSQQINPYYAHERCGESCYFPFSYILSYLFGLIKPWDISFWLFILLFVISLGFYNGKTLFKNKFSIEKIEQFMILTFATYPVLFSIDRANFEILLFIFLVGFVYFYQKEKFLISALLLSFAASMKLYPLLFIFLFISDKRYKEGLYVIIFSLIITTASLLMFKGGIVSSVQGLIQCLNYYKIQYGIGDGGLHFSSSLYGLIKVFLYNFGFSAKAQIANFFSMYFIFVLLSALAMSLYFIFVKNSFWKKVALIIIMITLLPFQSGDYKLMHFYIPMMLFIDSEKSEGKDLMFCILFGLLLIPKNYYVLFPPDINISIIINPLIMIIMLFLIIYKRNDSRNVMAEKSE